MKRIIFAMAALAVMGLSGCQSDKLTDEGIDGGIQNGKKAGMGLTFKMPAAAGTRAVTGDPVAGSDAENAVKTVDVFVFESNGVQAEVGGHTSLVLADFDVTGLNYSLKATKYIETLSGAKRVYVGINIPAAPLATFTATSDEAAMHALIADVTAMSDATTGFTMFSQDVATPTLVEDADLEDAVYNGITDGTSNIVTAQVSRVVAKVVTTSLATTYTKTWTGESGSNLSMVYTIKDFRVFQHALKSYIAPSFWTVGGIAKTYPGLAPTPTVETAGQDVFNLFATDASVDPTAIAAHPATDAALTDLVGPYIGENYPVDANKEAYALNGNGTYAMIATTVTADKYAIWHDNNTDGDASQASNPTDGYVEWVAMPTATTYGGGVTDSDIFVVSIADGKDFVTNTIENASAIAIGYGISSDPADNADGVGIYTYYDGYVHFLLYLNQETINDYAIARNQFVHVKINDVISGDFLFPGYPGDPTDPKKPTPATDPEGPDPIVDTDPIDGAPAWLDVDIEVLPWSYRPNDTILQ